MSIPPCASKNIIFTGQNPVWLVKIVDLARFDREGSAPDSRPTRQVCKGIPSSNQGHDGGNPLAILVLVVVLDQSDWGRVACLAAYWERLGWRIGLRMATLGWWCQGGLAAGSGEAGCVTPQEKMTQYFYIKGPINNYVQSLKCVDGSVRKWFHS